jgi:hypothetical protein
MGTGALSIGLKRPFKNVFIDDLVVARIEE